VFDVVIKKDWFYWKSESVLIGIESLYIYLLTIRDSHLADPTGASECTLYALAIVMAGIR